MTDINILSSSSKGNCIILENTLCLDIGVSYARIKQYLKNIKLIFITHCHQDHFNKTTVKKISYENPTIKYIVGSEDLVNELVELNVLKKNIYLLESEKRYDLGLFNCMLEPVTHDKPNHCIHLNINNNNILYVVDTQNVDNIKAKNYDMYLIEANYKEEILKKHIEECTNDDELYYLNRVSHTHLSYEQATNFLIENMGDNSKYIFVHKSNRNFGDDND